jgi:hypothetical protein
MTSVPNSLERKKKAQDIDSVYKNKSWSVASEKYNQLYKKKKQER